jgi:hypothetical protein
VADRGLQWLLSSSFDHFARPTMAHLEGMTDDEYLWEPVPGCWTVRLDMESGCMVADSAVPPPEPPPVTTIAWRIVHICSFLEAHGLRAVVFKRDGAAWDVPTPVRKTAALALDALANAITLWQRDLAGLDDVRLWEPLGPAAGPFGDSPVAGFVEHIHDEFVHHSAELGLLRDLYRAR